MYPDAGARTKRDDGETEPKNEYRLFKPYTVHDLHQVRHLRRHDLNVDFLIQSQGSCQLDDNGILGLSI